MSLKASFNHLELVPGNILYVAFAKVDDVQNIGQQRVQPQHSQQLPSPAQPLPQLQQSTTTTTNAVTTIISQSQYEP